MTDIQGLEAYHARLYLAGMARSKHDDASDRMPDVRALLARPGFVALGAALQDSIWTLRRLRRWLKGAERPSPAAMALLGRPGAGVDGRRIYIDVTATSNAAATGGIARVAERLSMASQATDLAVPVVVAAGHLRRGTPDGKWEPVTLRAGDCYVLIDHFWHSLSDFRAVVAQARAVSAKIVICVYDVIPLLYPTMIETGFVAFFRDCFAEVAAAADAIVTVSNASKTDIENYVAMHFPAATQLPIIWFHLGADATTAPTGVVRRDIANAFGSGDNLLSVGTMLPHKGHLIAVAAFERLWREGSAVSYIILGRVDPSFGFIGDCIRLHPEFGKRLFWFEDANDAELDHGYRAATALLQPSISEGFGLPIVEALRYGLPVIASDIPIFREIGGDSLTYVPSCDSVRLAEAIEQGLSRVRAASSSTDITWHESLRQLVEAVSSI